MKSLKEVIKGTSPFAEMLGVRVDGFGDGAGRCALEIREEMLNLHRSVHGGVIYSLADIGMGVAIHSLLGRLESCSTIEIKINYLKPACGRRLVCQARVLQKGKAIAFGEADIFDGDTLIARGTGTFAVHPGGQHNVRGKPVGTKQAPDP